MTKSTQIILGWSDLSGSGVIHRLYGLSSVALCGPAPHPQKSPETGVSGPLPPSPPCPPLISGVLEWRSSTGKQGGAAGSA